MSVKVLQALAVILNANSVFPSGTGVATDLFVGNAHTPNGEFLRYSRTTGWRVTLPTGQVVG